MNTQIILIVSAIYVISWFILGVIWKSEATAHSDLRLTEIIPIGYLTTTYCT